MFNSSNFTMSLQSSVQQKNVPFTADQGSKHLFDDASQNGFAGFAEEEGEVLSKESLMSDSGKTSEENKKRYKKNEVESYGAVFIYDTSLYADDNPLEMNSGKSAEEISVDIVFHERTERSGSNEMSGSYDKINNNLTQKEDSVDASDPDTNIYLKRDELGNPYGTRVRWVNSGEGASEFMYNKKNRYSDNFDKGSVLTESVQISNTIEKVARSLSDFVMELTENNEISSKEVLKNNGLQSNNLSGKKYSESLEVSLYDEELGDVTIRVEKKSGKINIEIEVSNDNKIKVIQEMLPVFKTMFGKMGMKVARIAFDKDPVPDLKYGDVNESFKSSKRKRTRISVNGEEEIDALV